MANSTITIRKPTELYGMSWPYQVWLDGQRAGAIGRYEAVGTFTVDPGVHVVSVSTARFIKSEPQHVTIAPSAGAELTMRRLAGARVSLKILWLFLLPLAIGPGTRRAARMLLADSSGFWAYLALSLLLGLTLTAACLGLTFLVAPRYWVWWSLTSDASESPNLERAETPAYPALR